MLEQKNRLKPKPKRKPKPVCEWCDDRGTWGTDAYPCDECEAGDRAKKREGSLMWILFGIEP